MKKAYLKSQEHLVQVGFIINCGQPNDDLIGIFFYEVTEAKPIMNTVSQYLI